MRLGSVIGLATGVQISLANFGGASAVGGAGDTVRAGFRFNEDGTIDIRDGAAPTAYAPAGTWRTGGGSGASYEVNVVIDSGPALDVGTVNTDLSLGSTQTFEQHVSNPDADHTNTLTVRIKRVSDGATIETKQVTLSASIVL